LHRDALWLLAPERDREHSIKFHLAVLNVQAMDRLHMLKDFSVQIEMASIRHDNIVPHHRAGIIS
jgi:hypothetical protein